MRAVWLPFALLAVPLAGCTRAAPLPPPPAVEVAPTRDPAHLAPVRADAPADDLTGTMVRVRERAGGEPPLAMDRVEVTVAAYARCVGAGPCAAAGDGPYCNGPLGEKRAQHPINCVRQTDAVAFCAWAGKRLPSEAEWELAAESSASRRFPWGEAIAGTELCWDGPGSVAGAGTRRGTCPVGSFPSGRSARGVDDLAGNVFEWTTDLFIIPNRVQPAKTSHAARGGSWVSFDERDVRASSRLRVTTERQDFTVGFRCVREEP